MTQYENYAIFPDGEAREIFHALTPGDIVDINAYPLDIPLPTNRMLAYQVSIKRTSEERGVVTTKFYLEQLSATDLLAYV